MSIKICDDVAFQKIENMSQQSINNMDDYFEIQRCIDFVNNNSFKNVVLQFPDKLMNYSKYVFNYISNSTDANIFILGDTSYGSCCVDEVAASHVNADSIIHIGPSCMSFTAVLPVLFIFGKETFNKDDFFEKINETFSDKNSKIWLFYDVGYYYYIKQVFDELVSMFPNVALAEINIPERNNICVNHDDMHQEISKNFEGHHISCFGRSSFLKFDISEYDILYVGGETLTLRNLLFKFNKNKVSSYDPSKNRIRIENTNVNKLLMKRYFLIEKAKDAHIVGIVMGTLGVARYKEMVTRLKAVLKHAGKKFYTFIVGKINIAKMANFMEIDIFVLVACPENSLIDSKEFYKPIITPYEMEIACLQNQEWTGDYITDFKDILPGGSTYKDIDHGNIVSRPEYSLITGQLRSNTTCSDELSNSQTDQSVCNKNTETQVLSYTASEYLSLRSWQGLEINRMDAEIKKATEGRSGIAMSYENEC